MSHHILLSLSKLLVYLIKFIEVIERSVIVSLPQLRSLFHLYVVGGWVYMVKMDLLIENSHNDKNNPTSYDLHQIIFVVSCDPIQNLSNLFSIVELESDLV